MLRKIRSRLSQAQAAVEYLLLLGAVTVVVLYAFKNLIPEVGTATNQYFNRSVQDLVGDSAEPYQP